MTTILITGFGPFPGAPFNPTGPLVRRLAKLRIARTKIVTHVFETSYAAVDRDLPKLIAKYKPDALLMFGLATRARTLRIETRARNALALLPDAGGKSLKRGAIAAGKPALMMPAPARQLLAAIRGERAALSRDAGRYLCNYLCWRAAEASAKTSAKTKGPRLAAFIHVPLIVRNARKAGKRRRFTLDDLVRAGGKLLVATVRHGSARKHP